MATTIDPIPTRRFINLIEAADLILENDGEYIYLFREKLWSLSVEVMNDYRHVTMIDFPDKDDMDEYVTEQILDYKYVVMGGVMRDEMMVDFND